MTYSLQVVLCIFCGIKSLLTLTRAFSFAFGGLHAAIQVYDKLLKKLIDGPINFFDQTPSGRILNSISEVFPTVSLNFARGASMILYLEDYLLQQNSIVNG
ncbi:hypothetical protein RHMOL_Rhmol06G0217300 [Rhododendron molle]|uniref:Uncharacterized protein n=1 Tax=Rhododendron molle TaxID=49168 RepID=A0ACC0NEZ0_RHOML|nr:hypothetical protein RHMOL_Rhmol06G0217300 [Rhododendron molle]